MNVITIASAKTSDLVKFFNDFADRVPDTKQVKKFSDRPTAEKRVNEFVAKIGQVDEAFYDLPEGHIPAPEGFEGEVFQAVKGVIQIEGETAADLEPADGSEEAGEEADEPAAGPQGHNAFSMLVQSVEAAHKTAAENGTTVKVSSGGSKASNSDGVAASWVDTEVRAARLKRDGVSVSLDGGAPVVYKSTREAFRVNRLPDNKHIRFRLRLKEAHRENGASATFEHNGKKYEFTIVSIEDDGSDE